MKSQPIQARVLLLSGFCMVVLIAVLVGVLSTAAARHHALFVKSTEALVGQLAEQRISAQSLVLAQALRDPFDAAHQTLRGLAANTLVLRDASGDSGYYSNLRSVMQSLMRAALLDNAEMTSVFAVWLPNAVDAQDEVFEADAEFGSNDVGRFSSRWTRSGANAVHNSTIDENAFLDSSVDGTGPRSNLWYLCPLESGRSCIMEPRQAMTEGDEGQRRLMSTLTVPLYLNGEVAGIYGVDIALDYLRDWVRDSNHALYQGAGVMRVISSGGLLVASSHTGEETGTQVLPSLPAAIVTGVGEGQRVLIRDAARDELWAALPYTVVDDTAPWFVVYQLPIDVALADAQTLAAELRSSGRWAVIAALCLGLIVAVVFFFALKAMVNDWHASR